MDRRKRTSSSISATFLSYNEDLLIQIFLFVPTRSLITFKLVNKQWNSIISGNFFRRLHTLYHQHPTNLILCPEKEQKYTYFIPVKKAFNKFQFCFPYAKILQSSHGLLLFEWSNMEAEPKRYYICNPVLNHHKELSLNYSNDDKTLAGLYLLFDPSKSPDYQVVCIWRIESVFPFIFRVEIYSRRTDSWEQLGDPFTSRSSRKKFNDGIYWNDCIYWIRHSSFTYTYVLDLKSGVFEEAPPIKFQKPYKRNKRYAMESNGHLYCMAHSWEWEKGFSFLVYEMGENKPVWYKKYHVNLGPEPLPFGRNDGDVNVLTVVGGETEECAVFFQVNGYIYCYWFRDKRIEVVFYLSRIGYFGIMPFGRCDTLQFIETLAPV